MSSRPRSRAERIYAQLVRLAPSRLRHKHGVEMTAMFAEALVDARRRGMAAVAQTWLRAAADIAGAWRIELGRRARRRGRVGIPREGRPIMIGSDIRYAVRSLSRQKFATGLVLAMLAIGIAANVAVFSLVNGLFLRPFPFGEPERLAYINEKAPKWNLDVTGINFTDFDQWRKDQKLFEAIAIWGTRSLNLADESGAERISAAQVTHELEDVLRIQPIVGRMFTAEEDHPKAPYVTVIGQTLWQERFGGDPNVLGRTLKLSGQTYTIIGVLPRAADVFPADTRLWIPLRGDPNQEGQSYGFEGVGRLRAGVTVEQAEQDLLRAHQPIFDKRDKERIVSPFVQPLRELVVRDYRTAASTLAVAVALLLAVACANVAAVMLARALARRREMAIRVAVGASRLRLLRQLFVENLLLATIGGVLGLLMGQWAIRALIEQLPDQAPPWASFGVDARVMLFAVLASVFTVLLFGWAPALHAVRGDLRSSMNNVANLAMTPQGGRRTLRLLIGAEFALATLLLVCGGLLFRAYDRVQRVDPGFNPQGVLTFQISLPAATYKDAAARFTFWERLEERMKALPGVERAGVVTCPPFGCHWGTIYRPEGAPPLRPDESNPIVLFRYATPPYAEAMGLRLKAGRWLDAHDGQEGVPPTPDSPPRDGVAVVNETFARTFFPGVENPVRRRFRSAGDNPKRWTFYTIVGIVQDVKHYGLERPMRPGVYFPLRRDAPNTMTMSLRTSGDPQTLVASARTAVRQVDPELPLFSVRTMDESMRRSIALRTTYSWMLAVFALMALVLALGGTYGVSSYLVTQRTREIGIRVALGARRADIVRGVLRASLAVAGLGIVVGVGASLGLARLLEGLLFGVKPSDALILSSAIGILVLSALVASVFPARRAARVDPMTSLRAE
jgi:predicted permease